VNIENRWSLRGVARRVLAQFRGSSPGASMVEYLIVTGSCALIALLAFHNFGRSLNRHLDTEAEHIHGRGMPNAGDLLDVIVDPPNPNCLLAPLSCLPEPDLGTGGTGSGPSDGETGTGTGGGPGSGSGGSDSGTGTGGSTGNDDGDTGSGTGGSGNSTDPDDETDGTDEEEPDEPDEEDEEDEEEEDKFTDK